MTCGCSFWYFYMYINACLRGAPPQVPALSIPQTGTGHDKWRVFVFVSSCCECFLLCWFWNFFLKSLCKSMLYLYGSWSSDVYNIMELFFVRVHIMFFFERSASTSAHSVNTTDRHRPWQWRVFVCVCVCHHETFVDSGISVWKVYAEECCTCMKEQAMFFRRFPLMQFMSLDVPVFSFCHSVLRCISSWSCFCMSSYNAFPWEEHLHKCPLC